jgi:hypothetical protein
MMWPVFVLVGIGRLFWIPLPVILLWPILVLLWIVSVGAIFFPKGSRERKRLVGLRGISSVFAATRGTRVRVVPTEGPRIRVIIV